MVDAEPPMVDDDDVIEGADRVRIEVAPSMLEATIQVEARRVAKPATCCYGSACVCSCALWHRTRPSGETGRSVYTLPCDANKNEKNG